MAFVSDSLDMQVLHDILVNLVTVPEDVKIERIIDEQGVLLTVLVNSKDMGIVIGRNGSMATAIKTVMRAIGKANKMNLRLHFLEPDGSIRYGDKEKTYSDQEPKSYDHVTSEEGETTATQTPAPSIIDEDLSDFVIN